VPVDSQQLQTSKSKPFHSDLSLLIKTPQRSKIRKAIFLIHKWVGVVVALYILLMSLTGVSLVFHDELSAWLCPSPKISVQAERTSFSDIVRNSEKEFLGYKVTGLIVSHENTHPVDVFTATKDGKKIHCEVDPFTGKVLGVKKENDVLKFLRDLHFNLLNGKTGRIANGVGAACLFTLVVTGLVVWWRGITNWLDGFRLPLKGSLKRVVWNLHSVLGIWLLPVLLVWSISGFYFGFPEFFEKNLNAIVPVSSQKKLAEPDDNDSNPEQSPKVSVAIPIDRFVEIAKKQSSSRFFVERIAYPDKRRKSVRVWLSDSEYADPNNPRTQVFLDPNSGKVLAVSTSEKPPMGDLIIQLLINIHFGRFLGTISKTAWLLIGLTPAVLSITGLFLFAHGIAYRKAKRAESSRLE